MNFEHCGHRHTRKQATGRKPQPVIERFKKLYRISDTRCFGGEPCWEWLGSLNGKGYGKIRVDADNQNVPAHRFAHAYYNGPVPDGFDVDHLCNVHHCVNPKHLEAVTPQENRRRRDLRKTHCKRGHPLSGSNLYICKQGKRSCRTCMRESVKRAYDRRKTLEQSESGE